MEIEKLKSFFENNDLAKKAARSLKDGRQIEIVIDDAPFTFEKVAGNNTLKDGPSENADICFHIPSNAAEQLLTREFKTVGEVGIFIFEKMLASDPSHKVRAKVKAGILSLVMGGYLGVLAEGGADVAKFLAGRGLTNPSKIKDAIAKLRG